LEEKKDPLYVGFVKKVMDLEILEAAVNRGEIQGPEGFLGEFKWLLHNTMILNGIRLAEAYSKYTFSLILNVLNLHSCSADVYFC